LSAILKALRKIEKESAERFSPIFLKEAGRKKGDQSAGQESLDFEAGSALLFPSWSWRQFIVLIIAFKPFLPEGKVFCPCSPGSMGKLKRLTKSPAPERRSEYAQAPEEASQGRTPNRSARRGLEIIAGSSPVQDRPLFQENLEASTVPKQAEAFFLPKPAHSPNRILSSNSRRLCGPMILHPVLP
jgi:hypothetical protein